MPKRIDEERHSAVGRLQVELNQSDIVWHMGACRATVNRLGVGFNSTGSTRHRTRSGRVITTTPAKDRYIRLMHLRDRFRTATSTASHIPGLRRHTHTHTYTHTYTHTHTHYHHTHTTTTTNRYQSSAPCWTSNKTCATQRSHGTSSRLTTSVVSKTFIWWRRARWRTVLFSYESRFMLFRTDGHSKLYRHNQPCVAICVLDHDCFGCDSVMV